MSCYNFVLYSTALQPVVNIDPPSITVDKGESAQFNCLATGVGASDFTYQWFLNREPWPGDGQNTPVLNIDAVSVNTTGDYTCSVQSPYGGIGRSEKATLILNSNCIAKYSQLSSYKFFYMHM